MLGAGAAARFGEKDEGGSRHQQDKHHHLNDGEDHAVQLGLGIGALQGIAPLQEEHTGQNTQRKAQQTQQGVQVAACQTQDHAEGAAQEHQAAHHHEEAQHKPGDRSAAALGGELLLDKRHAEAAQHQTDDLGPDVLYGGGTVQTQTTSGIPQEAGNAEAHVGGIAEKDQQRSNDADDQSGDDDLNSFAFDIHVGFFSSLYSILPYHTTIVDRMSNTNYRYILLKDLIFQ